MNNLWNEAIWKEINDEVRKVAGATRVAQKVFPTTILDNPSSIPNDRIDLETFSIPEGLTKPFIEISVPFSLTPNQYAHEDILKTGLKLAKLDAAVVAYIEDLLIFQGIYPTPPTTPPNIVVTNGDSADTGLLGLATPKEGGDQPPNAPINVPPLDPTLPGAYGQNTFNAVVKGISKLNQNSQPGPFGLILEYSVFADTYAALAPSFIITADRITPLVTGGFFGTAALPKQTGLLVSLGGEPTTLYVGIDATTAFTRKDDGENHFFRVFERVQFNARDRRAFVRLNFQPGVSKVDPPGGPPNTDVTITGFGFTGLIKVDFGKTSQTEFVLVSDTEIKLKSPRGIKGSVVDVQVTTSHGTSDAKPAYDKYTYDA